METLKELQDFLIKNNVWISHAGRYSETEVWALEVRNLKYKYFVGEGANLLQALENAIINMEK